MRSRLLASTTLYSHSTREQLQAACHVKIQQERTGRQLNPRLVLGFKVITVSMHRVDRYIAGIYADPSGDTGKRLPLYGVVGATFLFAGYSFYFKSQHPDTSSSVTEKNSSMPGKNKEEQAESRFLSTLIAGYAQKQGLL